MTGKEKKSTSATTSQAALDGNSTGKAACTVAAPEITIEVGPRKCKGDRLVIAKRDGQEIYRHVFDTDNATRRRKFVAEVARVVDTDKASLAHLGPSIVGQGDAADASLAEAAENATAYGEHCAANASQGTLIAALAEPLKLFRSPEGEAYASVPNADHRETLALRSKALEQWLRRAFLAQYQRVPNAQGLHDAVNTLEAKALEGEEHPVFGRIAVADTAIYIDLGDSTWEAVKITSASWGIIKRPAVRFVRTKGASPLARPKRGGTLNGLWNFVNVRVEDRPLIVAWLVQALNPRGPYPILCLHGPQGACKSTVTRLLRSLVDPSLNMLRSEPRNVQDLGIYAKHNWCVTFDNLSYLSPDLSDALCRMSTGGGFATRKLYSDAEEVVFDYQRPVVANGIEAIVNRADLLERAIVLDLPEIEEEARRTAQELWGAWEQAKPGILGALLDAVVAAMANLASTELPLKPRMADFALWAHASEASWGTLAGQFLPAYAANQDAAQQLPLGASPITDPLFRLLRMLPGEPKVWIGPATKLLDELEPLVGDAVRRRKSWPTNGQALSSRLRRLVPNLKRVGIRLEFEHSGSRMIHIETTDAFRSQPPSSSEAHNVTPWSADEEGYDDIDEDDPQEDPAVDETA